MPALWEPELLAKRLAAGREAMQLAMRAGDAEMALDTLGGWHIGSLLESGDTEDAERAMAFSAGKLSIRWQPFVCGVLLTCRTMIALHAGRFDEAERRITEQMQHAARYNFPQGSDAASVQM